MSDSSLLTNAIVYLGAAAVCVPLASHLKLGSVLGYLAAGCVIGPFGLRLVGDPTATLHFAEMGVVLMLFVIGLELDPKRLWTMRRAVFGGGALQLGACALVLGLLALPLGLPWQAALVAGLALGTVVDGGGDANHGRTQSAVRRPMGRTAFAILLFQDIAAIPMLALVPMLSARARREIRRGLDGCAEGAGCHRRPCS